MTTPAIETQQPCGCKFCRLVEPSARMTRPGLCHFPGRDGTPCGQPAAPGLDGRPKLYCESKPDGATAAEHNAKRAQEVHKRRNQEQERERAEAATTDPLGDMPWTAAATLLHDKLNRLPEVLATSASTLHVSMRNFIDEVSALAESVGDLRVFEREISILRQRSEADRSLRVAAEVAGEQAQEQADQALEALREERTDRLQADADRLAAETARADAACAAEDYRSARDQALLAAEQSRQDAVAAALERQKASELAAVQVQEAQRAALAAEAARQHALEQAAADIDTARKATQDEIVTAQRAAQAEVERALAIARTAETARQQAVERAAADLARAAQTVEAAEQARRDADVLAERVAVERDGALRQAEQAVDIVRIAQDAAGRADAAASAVRADLERERAERVRERNDARAEQDRAVAVLEARAVQLAEQLERQQHDHERERSESAERDRRLQAELTRLQAAVGATAPRSQPPARSRKRTP